MNDDKELEVQQINNEVVSSQNSDYLREESDLVKNIKNEETKIDVLENKGYSEQYAENANRHINSVDEQLAKMRANKDYGTKITIDGKEVQNDMDFLTQKGVIPDDLG